MICKHCSREIPENSFFCILCGQKVEPDEVAPLSEPPSQPEPQSEHCAVCGEPLAPDAAFCISCGAKVETPAASDTKLILPKRLIIGIIAGGIGALLIALSIFLISQLGSNSTEDIVELYFDAFCKADADAALKLLPEEMIDHLEEDWGGNNSFRHVITYAISAGLKSAERKYGEFQHYKYKIIDETAVDQTKLEEINSDLESDGYDMRTVTAKEVEIQYTVFFENYMINDTITLLLIKVNGSWYLYKSGSLFQVG
ncbi:MAG: zinc ribbon domain-containing protein [Eubacteriales bacterium]